MAPFLIFTRKKGQHPPPLLFRVSKTILIIAHISAIYKQISHHWKATAFCVPVECGKSGPKVCNTNAVRLLNRSLAAKTPWMTKHMVLTHPRRMFDTAVSEMLPLSATAYLTIRFTSLFFTTMVFTIRPPCFSRKRATFIGLGGGDDCIVRGIGLHVNGAADLAVDLDCHVQFPHPWHMASS